MKHQYVGDINDYRKYALLRALSASGGIRIGVCWMLTPSDGSMDGSKLIYLTKPEQYRNFDPELFDILAHAAAEPDRRRLQTIEDSGAIPGAVYFNEVLPDDIAGREHFFASCLSTLGGSDLVFFDPDNGIEVSLPKGRKNSSKYLYLDEVEDFYAAGRSMLIYQHFPRQKRELFVERIGSELGRRCPASHIWAFVTAGVVFFLVARPEHQDDLNEIAGNFALRSAPKFFVDVRRCGTLGEPANIGTTALRQPAPEVATRQPLLARMLTKIRRG